MMRRSTLTVLGIALVIGLSLFRLKYKVMSLEQHHSQVKKSIQENTEALHVLKAEWAHLNDPRRLQKLSEKYLKINPLQKTQLISFADVATGGGNVYDKAALDKLIADAVADQQPDND
jgi:hypothetical protein